MNCLGFTSQDMAVTDRPKTTRIAIDKRPFLGRFYGIRGELLQVICHGRSSVCFADKRLG